MKRWWLKSCPRCRGDLYMERYSRGYDIQCLQCGHYLTEVEEIQLGIRRAPLAVRRRAAEIERELEEVLPKAA